MLPGQYQRYQQVSFSTRLDGSSPAIAPGKKPLNRLEISQGRFGNDSHTRQHVFHAAVHFQQRCRGQGTGRPPQLARNDTARAPIPVNAVAPYDNCQDRARRSGSKLTPTGTFAASRARPTGATDAAAASNDFPAEYGGLHGRAWSQRQALAASPRAQRQAQQERL